MLSSASKSILRNCNKFSKCSLSLQSRIFSTATKSSPTTPEYAPSIWDSLFSKTKYPKFPLNQTWPGLPEVKNVKFDLINQSPHVTTLPNGLRVATVPSHSNTATITLWVDAGTRYENEETHGITRFYEMMALKSTSNRSDFRLVRELGKMGVHLTTQSARDFILYQSDSLKEFVPAVIGTLGDLIQNHSFRLEEVLEAREFYENEYETRQKETASQILENIHEAAYLNNSLGLPLYGPPSNLESFTSDLLREYQKTFFTPKRIVIGASGVNHDELVSLVQDTFVALPSEAGVTMENANYTGGDIRTHLRGDRNLVHLALAFEGPNWTDKDLAASCVLQTLMGGGGSFSAGGPGKGMYSRLYTNVLNQNGWVESCTSFNAVYADSGLFGIYGTAYPNDVGKLAQIITREMVNMTGPITEVELMRSKNQLKSTFLMTLESHAAILEDSIRQLITYGKIKSTEQTLKDIDAVTANDIHRVAKRMLSTPLSVAAIGNLTHLPRYDLLQKQFK